MLAALSYLLLRGIELLGMAMKSPLVLRPIIVFGPKRFNHKLRKQTFGSVNTIKLYTFNVFFLRLSKRIKNYTSLGHLMMIMMMMMVMTKSKNVEESHKAYRYTHEV